MPETITVIQLARASRLHEPLSPGLNFSGLPHLAAAGLNTISRKRKAAANRIDEAMWSDRAEASQKVIAIWVGHLPDVFGASPSNNPTGS
jgi:hypothetical protein